MVIFKRRKTAHYSNSSNEKRSTNGLLIVEEIERESSGKRTGKAYESTDVKLHYNEDASAAITSNHTPSSKSEPGHADDAMYPFLMRGGDEIIFFEEESLMASQTPPKCASAKLKTTAAESKNNENVSKTAKKQNPTPNYSNVIEQKMKRQKIENALDRKMKYETGGEVPPVNY